MIDLGWLFWILVAALFTESWARAWALSRETEVAELDDRPTESRLCC